MPVNKLFKLPVLSEPERYALRDIASSLNVSPDTLFALINFESGWDAAAKNKITGARGLIQFMPKTAQSLGYKDADDLVKNHPSRISQLMNPVFRYLQQFKPFTSDHDLFMSVFYPAYRGKSIYLEFPPAVKKANPGINKPVDYVKKLYAVSNIRYVAPYAVIALVAVTMYILSKGKLF